MAAPDNLPVRFESTQDSSRVENFLIPKRRLTPAEQAVYNKMKVDWARLDAVTRTNAFAQLQIGRLGLQFLTVWTQLVEESLRILDGVTHPRAHAYVERAMELSFKQDMGIMLGLKRATAAQIENIISEEYPFYDSQPNVWRRLLRI